MTEESQDGGTAADANARKYNQIAVIIIIIIIMLEVSFHCHQVVVPCNIIDDM
jgi:hypothetical protein